MTIVFISDTHGQHRALDIPEGDIIIHCGDFCHYGSVNDFLDFNEWYSLLPFKHKILIAGNHDFICQEQPEDFKRILKENITYLNDSGIEIEGVKFWGSPVQPDLVGWAFGKPRGKEMQEHWDLIPSDTDVLITHTPPKGILDRSGSGRVLGCGNLFDSVKKIEPRINAFGHVHASYGKFKTGNTLFINASNMRSGAGLVNSPVTIDLQKL